MVGIDLDKVQVNKELMKDTMGRPLTQSMFYEYKYAVTPEVQFTLGEEHKILEDRVLWSLKTLYLDMEDITEYEFARKYLLSWPHWQRLQQNKLISPHVNQWREELEYKIRASSINEIINQALTGDSFQAAKWLAERGWDKRSPGRPSKQEVQKQIAQDDRLKDEYSDDIARLKIKNGGSITGRTVAN